MRTTLTLDDDIAAKLQAETRRSGKPFRDVVNEMLRRGFIVKQALPPVRIDLPVFEMGLRSGLSLDNIEELIDEMEKHDAK